MLVLLLSPIICVLQVTPVRISKKNTEFKVSHNILKGQQPFQQQCHWG